MIEIYFIIVLSFDENIIRLLEIHIIGLLMNLPTAPTISSSVNIVAIATFAWQTEQY